MFGMVRSSGTCAIRLAIIGGSAWGSFAGTSAWTGGRYDNGKLIKDEGGAGYGFGWVIDKEQHIVSHSGSWSGTASYFLLDLEKDFTVAVLSNDENTDTSSLAEEILALFMTSDE
jgi:CubicO group peptidase (beta-lactamase class C family)